LEELAHAADLEPIVVAVNETDLAVSLELTLQALDLGVIIHDPLLGMSSLPLSAESTLIVDREALPKDPCRFFERLRAKDWRGKALVLTEDSARPEAGLSELAGIRMMEKPFVSEDLRAYLRCAHAPTPRMDDLPLD
jgi:hypothetical protein